MINFRDAFNKNVISKFREIKIANLFFLKKANKKAVAITNTYSPPRVVINIKKAVTGAQIIDDIELYTKASKFCSKFSFRHINKTKKIVKAIKKDIAFLERIKLCIKPPIKIKY